jgi:hypothetical protein
MITTDTQSIDIRFILNNKAWHLQVPTYNKILEIEKVEAAIFSLTWFLSVKQIDLAEYEKAYRALKNQVTIERPWQKSLSSSIRNKAAKLKMRK